MNKNPSFNMSTLKLFIDYGGHDCERDMLIFIARGPGYSKQFECKPEDMTETVVAEVKALHARYSVDPAGESVIRIFEVEK